jgi:hypothetical protein
MFPAVSSAGDEKDIVSGSVEPVRGVDAVRRPV